MEPCKLLMFYWMRITLSVGTVMRIPKIGKARDDQIPKRRNSLKQVNQT